MIPPPAVCYVDLISLAQKEKKKSGVVVVELKISEKKLPNHTRSASQTGTYSCSISYLQNQSLPKLTTLSTSLPVFQLRSDGYAYSDPFLSNMSYTNIRGLLLHILPASGIPTPVFFVLFRVLKKYYKMRITSVQAWKKAC